MVGARFGVGINGDGTRPELLCAHAREVDCGLAVHAGCAGPHYRNL